MLHRLHPGSDDITTKFSTSIEYCISITTYQHRIRTSNINTKLLVRNFTVAPLSRVRVRGAGWHVVSQILGRDENEITPVLVLQVAF